jgi:hypothetical protein
MLSILDINIDEYIRSLQENFNLYLFHSLRSRDGIIKLKELSDNYKRANGDDKNSILISINNWAKTNKPVTAAWIEASPSDSRTMSLLRRFNELVNNDRLISFISPGTYLDAGAANNKITDFLLQRNGNERDVLTQTIEDNELSKIFNTSNDLKVDEQEIIQVSHNGNVLLKFRIERIDDIQIGRKSKKVYVLHIEKFFSLECNKYGPLTVIGPYITIQIVWKTILDRLSASSGSSEKKKSKIDQSNANNPYPEARDINLFKEADICLKANKTSMDMLKAIYAINIFKNYPDYDKFSIFNDLNIARFFAAVSGDNGGVCIYIQNKIDLVNDPSYISLVINKEILKYLYSVSELQPTVSSLTVYKDAEENGYEEDEVNSFGKRIQGILKYSTKNNRMPSKTNKKFIQTALSKMQKRGTLGSFKKWCIKNRLISKSGKVTKKCINLAKKSPNLKIRRRAIFAQNIKAFEGSKRKKTRKTSMKIPAKLKKLAKKYSVRLTTKRGYKSEKLIKKQINMRMRKYQK